MNLQTSISINASKEKVWQMITNIQNAEQTISGIQKVEILEEPGDGLIGLKWRETRIMFGKEATEVMWITEAEENSHYKTRAESHGSIYISEMRVEGTGDDSCTLTMGFTGLPQSFGAKVMTALMGWMMKGATKKALYKDLEDIKAAAEKSA